MSAIEFDFWADLTSSMCTQLRAMGCEPPSDSMEIAAHFVNLSYRRIAPRPRLVLEAQGLVVPASVASGYAALIRKMQDGHDLNPHLSRNVLHDADYNDALLNDWGMHHFHLGTCLEEDGMVARTAELVFAIVQPQRVCIAGIGVHGEWAEHRLIDAVHEHWPELLMRLALEPGERPDPARHQQARRAGLHVVTVLKDGTPVVGLGGGCASSGRSIRVSMRVARMREAVCTLEARFRSLVPEISAHLERTAGRYPSRFRLTHASDGACEAIDVLNGISARLSEPQEPLP